MNIGERVFVSEIGYGTISRIRLDDRGEAIYTVGLEEPNIAKFPKMANKKDKPLVTSNERLLPALVIAPSLT